MLYKIGQWFRSKGLVGETELALIMTVVAVSGKPMGGGIIAAAGSGKTVVMDLLVGDADGPDDALIRKEHVYFKDAGSEKAFWYDRAINTKKIIVFKELQKDKSLDTLEAVKSITEGKSARRSVTIAAEDSVKEQKIEPKTVLFTYAVENKDVVFDTELARRCVTMSTDISKTQTDAVLNLKASLRWNKNAATCLTPDEIIEVRKHVNAQLNNSIPVINPFALPFAREIAKIAPDQKVRSMAEHFWDIMEGVARLNMGPNSTFFNGALIANVQDLLQTLHIYKNSFIRDVYSIPPMGDVVLRGFEDVASVTETKKGSGSSGLEKWASDLSDTSGWVDVNHLRKAIKEKQKVILAKNVVTQICRQLVDAGYLEDWKDGSTVKYQLQEKMRSFGEPDIDYLITEASKMVEADTSRDTFTKWQKQQTDDYIHPITGDIIHIKNG